MDQLQALTLMALSFSTLFMILCLGNHLRSMRESEMRILTLLEELGRRTRKNGKLSDFAPGFQSDKGTDREE